MAFRRSHPRQRRTCEEYKAELEEENYHLRSELQAEVDNRRANYRSEELRRKFSDTLPLLWLEKAEDIGEHLPLNKLAKKLYEIELRRIARHKRDRTSDPLVSNRTSRQIYEPSPVSASQQHGISLEDMQKAIQNALAQQKTEYQSLLEKQKADFQSQMPQYTPPDSDNEEDGYDKVENGWYYAPEKKNSQPETYDQLLSKLSPLIRKMCLSRKAQEEESKESDEWLSSLQYLNANINDLTISESFLDPGSEFGGINDPAIKALGWKADKPSNFAIKGNSKHITDSLGWYTDVPVTLKDKEDKTVTIIGNFVRIDNGETEPMLFFGMSNIRKIQGVPEPNKNQFRIKLHGKAYIIPTFSKAPVVNYPPKEEQDQTSTNSSNLIGEKDLKKSA
ncbi:hypothetical protein RhiirA1_496793 [Rhizophagus irregularis]|uniref:Uncharacterized protein n=1 Tax=Rhizophagus irregularis TaxID=588596 RepID=A0A2N0R3Z3_9GLOM|nr:hypothetical protein RhiirA1_496793 [Rhizophagus irregularis]